MFSCGGINRLSRFSIVFIFNHRVMSSSRKSYRNAPDKFCYICEKYTFKNQMKAINDFVRKIYIGYFKEKLDNQDKSWAHQIVCKACVESLRK